MIIIGAKGHAKEVLQILFEKKETNNLFFFDDLKQNTQLKFLDQFTIIKSLEEAKVKLSIDASFGTALGNPFFRAKVVEKFIDLGGQYKSIVSQKAQIGNFDVTINDGCNIMSNVFISNSVSIGKGCLINQGASIHHDVTIGDFCDISPKAVILGSVKIGNFVSIGAGSIILPDISISDNAIIGAGSIVTKNVLNGQIVYGNSAKLKK